MFRALLQTPADRTLVVLRLALGLMMFAHGAQKLLGWFGGYGIDGTLGFFSSLGIPAALGMLLIVGEFLAGLGLLVGFLARPAALGTAAILGGAVATIHGQYGFFMNWSGQQAGEGFELHLLGIAIAVAVLVRGAGAWSLDRLVADRLAADRLAGDTATAEPAFAQH